MGSFNVACSISNISLSPGDPVMVMPLIRSPYAEDELPKDSLLVSNNGPQIFYCPLTLPIKAAYGDYGQVDGIIKNDNTKCLELHYKHPIEDLVKHWLSGWWDEDQLEDVPNDAAMFIHHDIYCGMINNNFIGQDNNAAQGFHNISPYFLLKLGFSHKETLPSGRYRDIYTHPSSSQYAMASDGTWSHMVAMADYAEIGTYPSYNLFQLKKGWFKLTGHKFDIDAYQNSSMFLALIEEALADAKEIELECQTSSEETERQEFLNETRMSLSEIKMNDLFGCISSGTNHLVSPYRESLLGKNPDIDSGSLIRSLADFLHFNSEALSCNKFYFPAMNGEQCGNSRAVRMLAQKIMEISLAEEKEMEEDRLRWQTSDDEEE